MTPDRATRPGIPRGAGPFRPVAAWGANQRGFTLIELLVVIIVLSLLGVSLTSLAVIAGGLSVGIGFGMQNIFNNLVSGIMMLASLSYTQTPDLNRLNALKNALALLINLVAVLWFLYQGQVHWPLALWLMAGSLPGYFAGAHLAQILPPAAIRATVVIIGLAMTAWLLVH